MNAVENEAPVSQLAAAPFDAAAFPFAFLEAFGNEETATKKRRSGEEIRRGEAVYFAILLPVNTHFFVLNSGAKVPLAAALTAYIGKKNRIRALQSGFQIHVPKPISSREFSPLSPISLVAPRKAARVWGSDELQSP